MIVIPYIRIQTGTTRLIWSYNDVDPVTPVTFTRHKKQGTRSVNLFTTLPESDKPPLPSDVQHFDLHNPNVSQINRSLARILTPYTGIIYLENNITLYPYQNYNHFGSMIYVM